MIFIRKIEENDISAIVTAFNETIGCDGNFENYIKRCYKEAV